MRGGWCCGLCPLRVRVPSPQAPGLRRGQPPGSCLLSPQYSTGLLPPQAAVTGPRTVAGGGPGEGREGGGGGQRGGAGGKREQRRGGGAWAGRGGGGSGRTDGRAHRPVPSRRDAEDAVYGRDGYDYDGYRLRVEFPRSGRGTGRGGGGGGGGGAPRGRYGPPSRRSEYRVIVSGESLFLVWVFFFFLTQTLPRGPAGKHPGEG